MRLFRVQRRRQLFHTLFFEDSLTPDTNPYERRDPACGVDRGQDRYAICDAIIGLRLGKRRILAELSPFDFVAAVAVGAIVGRIPSASDADYPAGAVTLVAVLCGHALVSHLRHYSSVARLVDQDPKILVANGKVLEDALRRSGLSRADVESLLRQHGVHKVGEVEYLILEEGGKVSVVTDSAKASPSETDLFSDLTSDQTRAAPNTITGRT
jgi:uncharacterized membrane protein YcaP (DUF421 family)